MKLVPATMKDSDFLLTIRRDPVVKKWFLDQRKISKAEHKEWMQRALSTPGYQVFILMIRHEQPCGRGSLIIKGKFVEIALAVHKDYRGYGLGTIAIKALLRKAKATGKIPWAKVKRDNRASINAFLSAGMRPFPDLIEFRT